MTVVGPLVDVDVEYQSVGVLPVLRTLVASPAPLEQRNLFWH